MKTCTKCGQEKSSNDFYPEPKVKSGLTSQCRVCINERNKNNIKARRLVSPEVFRARKLWERYKMTADQYDQMLASQQGRCASCYEESPKRLYVDHDHACCNGSTSCGKCVRGLLCAECNRGLGAFSDSPKKLIKAAEYLNRYKDRLDQ